MFESELLLLLDPLLELDEPEPDVFPFLDDGAWLPEASSSGEPRPFLPFLSRADLAGSLSSPASCWPGISIRAPSRSLPATLPSALPAGDEAPELTALFTPPELSRSTRSFRAPLMAPTPALSRDWSLASSWLF